MLTNVSSIRIAREEKTRTARSCLLLAAVALGRCSSQSPPPMFSMARRVVFTPSAINQIRKALTLFQSSKVNAGLKTPGPGRSSCEVDTFSEQEVRTFLVRWLSAVVGEKHCERLRMQPERLRTLRISLANFAGWQTSTCPELI